MTPGGNRQKPRYYCSRSVLDKAHPLPHGRSESKFLDAIMLEAEYLRAPGEVVVPEDGGDLVADMAKLEAARELIGEEAYQHALAGLSARAGQREAVQSVPPRIDWNTWDTSDINRALRAMFERIELDETLEPKTFIWRVPEWRADVLSCEG